MMKCDEKIIIKSIAQKKNSKKYIVQTNIDEYILDEDTIVKYEVISGREFFKKDFDKILNTARIAKLYNSILNYLSYGPRSKKEIYQYIDKKNQKKEYKAKDYHEIISKLIDLGYIDDQAYCKEIVLYYKKSKGKKYVRDYLKNKGIDHEMIEECLVNYLDIEEEECANILTLKYSNYIRKYPLKKQEQMLMTYLLRNGFSNDCIKKVVYEFEFVDESSEELLKDFHKLEAKYQKKEISDYEKKQHIIASLISKGYSYERIKDIF